MESRLTEQEQPMRADNSHHLLAAARRRAEQTRARAVAALRRMDRAGRRINYDTVAREAGVSRSWLYAQHDLRLQIDRLRARHSMHPAAPSVPNHQRASDVSLLRRLQAATERIRRLEEENQQLRETLSKVLGQRRQEDVIGQITHRDTPDRNNSKIIGPCN
jgi:hypothetical protein